MVEPVEYRVALRDLHAHLFDVEATFPPAGDPLDLWLPAWTPGSYLLRELARHVQGVAARDGGGRRLAVDRRDKHTWRVAAGGGPVTVSYRVYANELSVRTSHLDGTHGFFNGTCLFLSSDALRARPCRLVVEAPAGWRAFTGLQAEKGAFWAADYDELVDCPCEIGPHEPVEFRAAGAPHRLVIWGGGNYDRAALGRDLSAIAEAEVEVLGEQPCRDYTFLLHAVDKGRGGLEHRNSTTLVYPRFGFAPRKSYEEFLSLAAHEYFHLWNVKRIKPRAFVPYAYGAETYTTLLWAMEGITSYYDTLILRRAALVSPKRYLERVGEAMTALLRTPGRRVLSLAEASRLAWIKHYRPDENSPNTAVSYYVKGEIVALLLDLLLRQRTKGQKSLDDVMRLLWKRYGDGSGMPEDGIEAAASEVAGTSLGEFFDRSIRSTDELDLGMLSAAGLSLRSRPATGAADKGGTPPSGDVEAAPRCTLGVTLKTGTERPVIATALSGSPASAAGLYAEDEILAVDGYRVDGASLQARLDDRRPGDRVRLTVFRRDALVDVSVVVGEAPLDAYYLEPDVGAGADARALGRAWLGEALPG